MLVMKEIKSNYRTLIVFSLIALGFALTFSQKQNDSIFEYSKQIAVEGELQAPDFTLPEIQDRDSRQKRFSDIIKLMQYTGLKDRNGKEIYEGDIRKGDWVSGLQEGEYSGIQVMKWDETNACFGWEGQYIPDFIKVEVIGNIYENPELLENNKTDKEKE